ncbi:HNH endonuclease [Agrobacterium bohemicum]|uniref:HNH endonuclease 5 domain-containing protein n=1 Tax=Agrobacterium bohemicum TaxID=2052828 RepID=A0A135P8D2_9HYPH|nr:HNH endonuclease [Agrobacterium bohemicum]KXG87608.1 hypothetical protein ATO67_18345 [Agrobacterium bohemicum]
MKTCLYCSEEKAEKEFSDEHIWPNALGGDFLPKDIWRTDEVCQRCNSISGLFVDGEFIRGWIGQAERSQGSLEYLAGKKAVAPIPLDYLGPLQGIPVPVGHIADYWAGPCGANIIHIRPDDGNPNWTTYSGGNPIIKKGSGGRAYIALTSEEPFWIMVSLESFRHHFDKAERYVVNANISPDWGIGVPDPENTVQAEDMKTVDAVDRKGRAGEKLHLRPAVAIDTGGRMLAKLGLAVGYKLLGDAFLATEYASHLRAAMREGDFEKRRAIPVRGSSFLKSPNNPEVNKALSWPGAWVLMINVIADKLSLSVISPSGRSMTVLVSDEKSLLGRLDAKYADGVVWITVVAAKKAVGPFALPDYITHKLNVASLQELEDLEAMRGDPAMLPPCK